MLRNENVCHIRGIAERYAAFGEASVYLIGDPSDGSHAVGGDAPLNFQKERPLQPLLTQTADISRFGEKALLRTQAVERGMRREVIGMGVGVKLQFSG